MDEQNQIEGHTADESMDEVLQCYHPPSPYCLLADLAFLFALILDGRCNML